ncbi:MAG: ribonuclease HII [Eubacterium sp.]|nr:ribonuclease HII [Eubacterium sp.]
MLSIKEIKAIFDETPVARLEAKINEFINDERSGVIKIVESAKKRIIKHENEIKRLDEMLFFEKKYRPDCKLICGIDEAGRGPFAGPVVAGAVILPVDIIEKLDDPDGMHIEGLNDSKKVNPKRREELYDEIIEKAVAYGVGISSPARIDEINILQATYEAMKRAIEDLGTVPDMLLNDAVTIPEVHIRQVGIVKGDARSLSIAAASIIAKVTRDRMMIDYAEVYPEYGFEKNKGYGSAEHIKALKEHGPCPIHRQSFIHSYV